MAHHRNGSRRHASRLSFALLAAAAVAALGIYAVRNVGRAAPSDGALLAHEAGPPIARDGAASGIDGGIDGGVDGAVAPPPQEVELVRRGNVATTPATAPTTPPPTTGPAARPPRAVPSGDAATILRDAAAKRDAGDLVTARDLASDALQGGRFAGDDVAAAKDFVGALNDKIIFGTQKFPADAFNKTWKVEPGTVLVKLARRFDVTAELLCKVNGLSRPDRLQAGKTIKTIQGPFHAVVSKSRFEADVYLGAPGGPDAVYVRTLRVGLGSDGSTPLGTWRVDVGKLVNPVYYGSRGEGVIAADDEKNPLGERWIPLEGIEGAAVGQESYGIHGTIEPDSIGKNMSQGCIRLASDDINLLYDLLVEGKSLVKVVE